MKVMHLNIAGGEQEKCCHKVNDQTQEWRDRMKKMHGHKTDDWYAHRHAVTSHPTKCGKNATYLIGGLPMCRTHAATAVLDHMLEQSRPKPQ